MGSVNPGPGAATGPVLRRELRLLDAVAVGLGAIIGAGLFVVTGLAARIAGPSFLLGLLIAGAVATFNALSSAQLAAAYPRAGGTYEYGRRVLGPHAGFVSGWLFLVSKLAAAGTVALGFGAAAAAVWPWVPVRAAAVTAAAALTAANLSGIRRAGRLNTAIVAVTLASLGVFVAVALPAVDLRNLAPFAPAGARAVFESAALLFFAYTGYARLATLGEEVHEPRRTIPRAIVIALVASIVLYLVVAFAAVGVIGAPRMGSTSTPLQAAAEAASGPAAAVVVGAGAMTAMLGVLLSQIFGISRMAFAMARGGDLPSGLAAVDPAHGVPRTAVLLAGGVTMAVALFGAVAWIVGAATFAISVYYAVTNVAALAMPAAERRYPAWISAAGLAGCMLLALSQRPATVAAGLALLAVGWLFRAALRRSARG